MNLTTTKYLFAIHILLSFQLKCSSNIDSIHFNFQVKQSHCSFDKKLINFLCLLHILVCDWSVCSQSDILLARGGALLITGSSPHSFLSNWNRLQPEITETCIESEYSRIVHIHIPGYDSNMGTTASVYPTYSGGVYVFKSIIPFTSLPYMCCTNHESL